MILLVQGRFFTPEDFTNDRSVINYFKEFRSYAATLLIAPLICYSTSGRNGSM